MSKEITLKYGCNPNQIPSRIYTNKDSLPITVINGNPGYINFLDALNGWQLVSELRQATELPSAASFKHVSPAGAAVAIALSETEEKAFFVDDLKLSPLAIAYARARGADRVSSFGDFIALSDTCDLETAKIIQREVSDGVIAPGYTPEALEVLKSKRKGSYNIIVIDRNYVPDQIETKQVFGLTFEQKRNDVKIISEHLSNITTKNTDLHDNAKRDLLVALITLKYTQSNSVCFAYNGQAIGVGAGQQSRIHCTRLAAGKADNFFLRQHPKVLNLPFKDSVTRPVRDNSIDLYVSGYEDELLKGNSWQEIFSEKPTTFAKEEKSLYLKTITDVSLGSDAFFPFSDNIDRAAASGVKFVAQPGGSIRDDLVINACDLYGMVMAFTGIRLFHH